MLPKVRNCQATSFLKISGFLLILLSLPAFALAQQPEGPWSQLQKKAQNRGQARVIVHLAEDTPLSRNLSTPFARSNRRQAIRNLQEKFIRNYETSGFRSSRYKRFKFFPYLAMDVDSKALKALQDSPWITGIEEDTIEFANLSDSVPLIGGDQVIAQGFDGTGWTVAILDTGVDKTHSFLGSRVVAEACFSTTSAFSDATSVCPGGVEESTDVGSGINCDANDPSLSNAGCNHGTHVAGITSGSGASFTGVAPGSNILAIQVFSKFDSVSACSPRPAPCVATFRSDQIQGLEHVLSLTGTLNIASVNMSLGGGSFSTVCDAFESLRKTAIDNLRAVNVATVIASGNNGSDDSISTPSCISTAVSVGSTTKSDNISSFSNRADFLSLMAPGSSINSSVTGGGFQFFNGTSMAAPHVAGTWAVLKQAMAAQGQQGSVNEILAALQSTGTPILDSSTGLTYFRINVDEALEVLSVPRVHNDFNADSGSDLLFVRDTGMIANALLDNSVQQSFNEFLQINLAQGWTVNATGHFNSDNNADLLLYNTTTGDFRMVWMDGTTILSDTVFLTLDPVFGLVPQGVGDFDGNGRDEIVVFDPVSGFTAMIFLDDTGAFSSFEVVTVVDTANDWTLHNTGDYNGDGKTDLLLYNTVSGETWFLEMDGSLVSNTIGLILLDPSVWALEETGDFDGNGNTDLLFVDGSGLIVVIALQNGLFQSFFVPGVVPANSEIINTGRYDGDNKDDFLIRNTVSGNIQTAIQDGTQITSFNNVLTLDPSTGWVPHSGRP